MALGGIDSRVESLLPPLVGPVVTAVAAHLQTNGGSARGAKRWVERAACLQAAGRGAGGRRQAAAAAVPLLTPTVSSFFFTWMASTMPWASRPSPCPAAQPMVRSMRSPKPPVHLGLTTPWPATYPGGSFMLPCGANYCCGACAQCSKRHAGPGGLSWTVEGMECAVRMRNWTEGVH